MVNQAYITMTRHHGIHVKFNDIEHDCCLHAVSMQFNWRQVKPTWYSSGVVNVCLHSYCVIFLTIIIPTVVLNRWETCLSRHHHRRTWCCGAVAGIAFADDYLTFARYSASYNVVFGRFRLQ